MARPYTRHDVDRVFDEFREVVMVNDPDPEDYSFRMDALIRFWLLEMQDQAEPPEQMFEALQQAITWAGWQAVFHVASGTVH